MDTICFGGKKFPLITLNSPFGEIKISTYELNNSLMTNYGDQYVSEEARHIDEQIFYFVEKKHLELNTVELVDKILNEI